MFFCEMQSLPTKSNMPPISRTVFCKLNFFVQSRQSFPSLNKWLSSLVGGHRLVRQHRTATRVKCCLIHPEEKLLSAFQKRKTKITTFGLGNHFTDQPIYFLLQIPPPPFSPKTLKCCVQLTLYDYLPLSFSKFSTSFSRYLGEPLSDTSFEDSRLRIFLFNRQKKNLEQIKASQFICRCSNFDLIMNRLAFQNKLLQT